MFVNIQIVREKQIVIKYIAAIMFIFILGMIILQTYETGNKIISFTSIDMTKQSFRFL